MEILFTPLKHIPLLLPSLAWLLGLVLARLQILSLSSIGLVSLLLFFVYIKWRGKIVLFLIFGLIFASLSLFWDKKQVEVEKNWLGHKIEVTAKIEKVVKTQQYTRLRISSLHQQDGYISGLADVYLYRNHQALQPDMLIKATLKFHQPRNKKNPAYFDYEYYAFERHIALIGSVSGDVEVVQADISWLSQQRQKVRGALGALNEDKQGILLALLLADRSKVPLDISDAFAASGTTHLLAISGLHVGLIAGWGFMLMWWCITRREAWIVRFPVRTIALGAGMLLALVYATLAGWPIPAQRASLMLFAAILAWALRAHHMPINTMLLALMLMTLLDPAAVLSVSLWLSFIATTALLIWAGQQQPTTSVYVQVWLWFKGMFWVSLIASLATLPLIGFIFERLPVWSLLANLFLVPLYAFWVLPLALLGEFLSLFNLSSAATQIFSLSGVGLGWGNQFLTYIYTLPAGNVWLRGDLPWMYGLLVLLLLMVGLFWLQQRRKIAVILLVSSLMCYATVMLSESKTEQPSLYVWDVGQGASALLDLPDFHLLIDAPGKRGSQYNGGTIANQNMRKIGLLHLDAVVFSHAQSDHVGGLPRLLATTNDIHELWLADVPGNYVYPAIQAVAKDIHILWLKQGDKFVLKGGTEVEVLWPPKGYAPSNSNNASLVLRFVLTTGQTLLFAGDMEKQVEQQILSSLSPVDVMLMPHHGSKTSSTSAFVDKVRPRIVIAQTGYKNHYGFPKAEVVNRYEDVGSRVLNTADGFVAIVFKKNEIVVK